MAQKQFKIGLSNTNKQNMAQDVYERVLALTFNEYDTTTQYDAGDFVVYNDKLYKCIGSTSGAWDSTKWQLATLNDLVTDIENAVAFVNDKANVDGNYPTMTVGLADNLNTKIVQNEKEAYLFRTTGGSLEVGNNCKEKGIVGGSLGFNQIAPKFSTNGTWWRINGGVTSWSYDATTEELTCTATSVAYNAVGIYALNSEFIQNHKYLVSLDIKPEKAVTFEIKLGDGNAFNKDLIANTYTNMSIVGYVSATGAVTFYAKVGSASWEVGDAFKLKNPNIIDLTAMFGATIADYIYTLEQGEAGAGVAWFKRYFNKPYYPYTAVGGFIHVKTSGKKVVGFNQWDEETKTGSYNTSTGEYADGPNICSKNPIKVLPNIKYCFTKPRVQAFVLFYDADMNCIQYVGQTGDTAGVYNKSAQLGNGRDYYLFTTPDNCAYIQLRFDWSTYENNVCINFHYDGERDGEYEPYESNTYANDDIELIGIPKIDAQGNLYYEGNIYRPDGTVVKKYGKVVYDGSQDENWTLQSINASGIANFVIGLLGKSDHNIICNRFEQQGTVIADTTTEGFLLGGNYDSFFIRIKSTTASTVEQFKTWLASNNVEVVYEKATPTEDSATPFQEAQQVDNWGTEEYLAPENDARPCEVPVGHDTDYLLDLKSKLEIMPDSPSDDGTYVVKTESGVNTYIPLATWLSDNGYVKPTNITGYDAAKTQVLKNVEGTLTWVDEE